jgi:SAM-dependent methyltransferase
MGCAPPVASFRWLARLAEVFLGIWEEMMADQQAASPHAAQGAYWNSAASRAWADEHERQDRALVGLAKGLLDLAAPRPGERVIDIGCGSGTTVLELAALVGPAGRVTGADISRQSVARAQKRIAATELVQAEVICADVVTHPFAADSFDLAFSRLGVMFFGDPTAAFANVHRTMKPGGRVTLGVFREPSKNPWPADAVAEVRHLLPSVPAPGPEDPGPFSWAEPARVHRILAGAGFRDISLIPLDVDMQLAGVRGGVGEAAEFAMLFGPLTRLPSVSEELRDSMRPILETFFQRYATPQGVVLPAAF